VKPGEDSNEAGRVRRARNARLTRVFIGGKMINKFSIRYFVTALLLVVLVGCVEVVKYHANYLPENQVTSPVQIEGKGLLYTDISDDEYVFNGKAESVLSGGASLSMPLGEMNKEISKAVFGGLFKGGLDVSNSLERANGYRAIIKPRVTTFSWDLNTLRTVGFGATPQVKMQLNLQILNSEKKIIFEKTYDSGVVRGDYYFGGRPGERINKLSHTTMFNLMTTITDDLRRELQPIKAAN
jgi:hypothetical protein